MISSKLSVFSGKALDLRAQVSQRIDVDVVVSESPEIITKQPQRQEQGKIVHNVYNND